MSGLKYLCTRLRDKNDLDCEEAASCIEGLKTSKSADATTYKRALESLSAQFNQPHQEYFGDAIQDAIKDLMK